MLIAKNVGVAIGKMHDAEIIHGDLTTSNIMVKNSTSASETLDARSSSKSSESVIVEESGTSVVLIDFGLGMMKPTMEDKAVDLYVLERAFISTHPGTEQMVCLIAVIIVF
jgi:TP53 regulating kinase and related kinases